MYIARFKEYGLKSRLVGRERGGCRWALHPSDRVLAVYLRQRLWVQIPTAPNFLPSAIQMSSDTNGTNYPIRQSLSVIEPTVGESHSLVFPFCNFAPIIYDSKLHFHTLQFLQVRNSQMPYEHSACMYIHR